MKVTFVANQCVPFDARSLEERPLGGVETGVIRLSEILHARNHSVTVYTPHRNPAASGPRYVTLTDANLSMMSVCDVLVAVREWKILMSPAHAELRLFWTGDSYDVPATFGIGDLRVQSRIDGLLLGSEWHSRQLCSRAGFPQEKSWILGCGVHLPHFSGEGTRSRKRLIYSSAPVRGLVLMPRIYRRVKAMHPDAELHVFAGFETYTGGPGGDHQVWSEDWRSLAATLRELPGCTVHGNVSQKDLARAFMNSSILAYPNTFNETFCMTVAEAQAAGCAVVTSDRAGLPETVDGCGVLVSGLPGSSDYENDFVAAVDRLLRDDHYFQLLSAKALARAKAKFDWEVVADRFECIVAEALVQKRGRRQRAHLAS